MSADAGPRKRFKDKKRKKGNSNEMNAPVILQKDIQPTKLIIDETMHVHNESNFGGNIFSKLIFLIILLGIGIALFFVFAKNDNYEDGTDESSNFLQYLNLGNFFSGDNSKDNVELDNQEELDKDITEESLFEIFWRTLSFYRDTGTDVNADNDEESNRSEIESRYPNNEKEEDLKDSSNSDDELEDDDNNDDNDNDDDDEDDDDDNNNDGEDDDDDTDSGNKNNAVYDEYDEVNYRKSSHGKYVGFDGNSNYRDSIEEDEDPSTDDHENFSPQPNVRQMYYNFENIDDVEDNETDDQNDDENSSDPTEEDEELSDSIKQPDFHNQEENDDDDSDDPNAKVNAENEPSATNVVTKLGVGIALMFVAYSVIIRKWNDYENLVPPALEDESEFENEISDIENDETATPQLTRNESQIFDENSHEDKSKSSDEYSESPSETEKEETNDNLMQQLSSKSEDILMYEIEDSDSLATDSDEENSDENLEVLPNRYLSEDYDKANITNTYDWRLKDELDEADQDFDNHLFTDSLNKYEKILQTYPNSARAKFGIASSLDAKAELHRSNKILARAIEVYVDTLHSTDIPDALFRTAAERAINRMRFKGEYEGSIAIQNLLIERFPNSVSSHNDLIVSLLTLDRIPEAKEQLERVLRIWPDNGLALVNYGFVLKIDKNLTGAVYYLTKGIKTNENGTQEGRFYFHLGDALQRLGRNNEVMEVYKRGVEKGLFLSELQRSLYNVKRLTGKPWWTIQQTTYEKFFSNLKKNWKAIREEGMLLLKLKDRNFVEESEQLRETGSWKQFELFSRGTKRSQCHKAPITCKLVGEFEPAAGCRRGQVKFSVMEPGTHVWPHCGPTNCRLRAHLGLVVPSNVTIRVASEIREWKESEILVFDDSFEHEVWHNGTSVRLILIIDVWHPELTFHERKTLSAI